MIDGIHMSSIFDFKSKRFIASIAAAAICLAVCRACGASMKVAIVFSLLLVFAGCFSLEEGFLPDGVLSAGYALWIAVCAFATLFLSQFIQNESVFALPLRQILLGFICCIVPMLALFALTLRPRLSGLLTAFVLLILSTANHYVYAFRGSELCPADLLSLVTAANVANKYTFSLPGQVLYSWLLFAVFVFFSLGLPRWRPEKRTYWRLGFVSAAAAACFAFMSISPGVVIQHFLHGGSYWNGFLLNFTLEIGETVVRKPEGYSPEQVNRISAVYSAAKLCDKTPDIIVIMDEAFADLGVLGNGLDTNIPVTPFIDSLDENTLKGHVLTSVYGGGTSNSEYEFLTGNSLLFVNGIIYQQRIRRPSYSLVSALKERGYTAVAMHPYLADGWRRESVWPNLLFDRCMFLDDFPQQDLVRGLVNDREMFRVLFDLYTEHTMTSDDPIFIFGVTMQNHSAYDYEGEDFENYVKLTGVSGDYPEVEQYLTLIHETDAAVESLLRSLETVDRDVVVVFYGDHQPAVSDAFIREIHGSDLITLDENQLLHKVPFFIWTNYESGKQELPLTSLNYLSGYMFEKAGMPLPPYNRFVRDIEAVVPVMNSKGFYSPANGCFMTAGEAAGAEKEALQRYWTAEYNSLFDLDHLDPVFFPLNQR